VKRGTFRLIPLDWHIQPSSSHSPRQAGRGFASVLMSLIRHAGGDAASDSTLGAVRRNDCGEGDSLLARPLGNETRWERVTG